MCRAGRGTLAEPAPRSCLLGRSMCSHSPCPLALFGHTCMDSALCKLSGVPFAPQVLCVTHRSGHLPPLEGFPRLHVIMALLLNADCPAILRSSPTRFTGSVLLNTQRVLSRSRSRHRQARKSHVEPVLTNSRLVGVRPVRGIKRNPQCTSCVVSAALESLQ